MWEAPATCLNLTVVQGHPGSPAGPRQVWYRALPFLVVAFGMAGQLIFGMAGQLIYCLLLGASVLWKFWLVARDIRIDPSEENAQDAYQKWFVGHAGIIVSMTCFYSAAAFLCAAAYSEAGVSSRTRMA